MSKRKSKSSVCVVISKRGLVVGYLSRRDEEHGLDIVLDNAGYKIIAL